MTDPKLSKSRHYWFNFVMHLWCFQQLLSYVEVDTGHSVTMLPCHPNRFILSIALIFNYFITSFKIFQNIHTLLNVSVDCHKSRITIFVVGFWFKLTSWHVTSDGWVQCLVNIWYFHCGPSTLAFQHSTAQSLITWQRTFAKFHHWLWGVFKHLVSIVS